MLTSVGDPLRPHAPRRSAQHPFAVKDAARLTEGGALCPPRASAPKYYFVRFMGGELGVPRWGPAPPPSQEGGWDCSRAGQGLLGRPTCWPINNPGRPVGPGGGWVSFRGCLGQMPPWPFGLKSKPPLKGDSFSQQQAAALRAKSGPNMAASLQKESYKDDTLIIQFLRDILTSSTSDDAGDA